MSYKYISIYFNQDVQALSLGNHKGSDTGGLNRVIAGGRGVNFQCPVRCFYPGFILQGKCDVAVTFIGLVASSTKHIFFLQEFVGSLFPSKSDLSG